MRGEIPSRKRVSCKVVGRQVVRGRAVFKTVSRGRTVIGIVFDTVSGCRVSGRIMLGTAVRSFAVPGFPVHRGMASGRVPRSESADVPAAESSNMSRSAEMARAHVSEAAEMSPPEMSHAAEMSSTEMSATEMSAAKATKMSSAGMPAAAEVSATTAAPERVRAGGREHAQRNPGHQCDHRRSQSSWHPPHLNLLRHNSPGISSKPRARP
jgi:hypothetical protein